MTHFLPKWLPIGNAVRCRAWLATEPNETVYVFVHGFNGDPVGTWRNFPALADDRSCFRNADLLFYGYDSLRTPATISASLFRDFLDSVWREPHAHLNEVLEVDAQRTKAFRYRSVVIVAHSLGSIVARQALIDSLRKNPAAGWADHCRLVLFAPAHNGAAVVRLAAETLTGLPALGFLLKSVTPALKFRYPVLLDLETGSDTLIQLSKWTNTLLEKRPGPPLAASAVVWGKLDKVVRPLVFGADPPVDAVHEKGHTSVCKPDWTFLKPIHVLEGLA